MSVALYVFLGGFAAYALLATGLWLRAARRLRSAAAELALMRHDPVTGLLTRRPWLKYAHQILASWSNPTLVMCDLNRFKQVNDLYGHADGDAVLAHFARVLRCEFGRGALIGRFGGDEFVVLTDIPRTDMASSWGEAGGALQEAAADCVVFWRGGIVGASFGIAHAAQLPGFAGFDKARDGSLAAREQLGRLLHAADLACREAKHRCRADHLITAAQVFDPRTHIVPEHLPITPTSRARYS